MVEQFSNDNSTRAGDLPRTPDPHGQAAMLLVESLIHGLIAKSVVTVADAVEIVGVAAEIKVEVAAELGDTRAIMEKSLTLLGAIKESLRSDLLDSAHDGAQPT